MVCLKFMMNHIFIIYAFHLFCLNIWISSFHLKWRYLNNNNKDYNKAVWIDIIIVINKQESSY